MEKDKFYILKQQAVPEVLLKVVEVNRLLETKKNLTVQEATDRVGISRSSYYKYRDYIFPFHDNTRGRTLTFILQVFDKPGLLSSILKALAGYSFNILTIHQSVPVNNLALITLSVEVPKDLEDVTETLKVIEEIEGVYYLKILARE
ncbi:MAG: ACT domain-containing protein [Clostridiales bacterium]|nr:ACT domain-containing protein [Clostridiales bacterium]